MIRVISMSMLCFVDRRKAEKINLEDQEWEVKTITSALKNYFRYFSITVDYSLALSYITLCSI